MRIADLIEFGPIWAYVQHTIPKKLHKYVCMIRCQQYRSNITYRWSKVGFFLDANFDYVS